MRGNFFPRFQAPPPRVRLGLRARCHFSSHSDRSCRVAELSHRLGSAATAQLSERHANPALCPSLPLNTRCSEAVAGHSISQVVGTKANLDFQEGSYEADRHSNGVFRPVFRFDWMAASTST